MLSSPPNRHKRFRASGLSGSYFKVEPGSSYSTSYVPPSRPQVSPGWVQRPSLTSHHELRDPNVHPHEPVPHHVPGDPANLELMAPSPGVPQLYSSSSVLALQSSMSLVPQMGQLAQMSLAQMPQMPQMRSYGSLKSSDAVLVPLHVSQGLVSMPPLQPQFVGHAPYLGPHEHPQSTLVHLPLLDASHLRPVDAAASEYMYYLQKPPPNVNVFPQQTLYLLYVPPGQFPPFYFSEGGPQEPPFVLPQRPGVSSENVLSLSAKSQGYEPRAAYSTAHGKTISIASHFDMFSLQERPHEQAAPATHSGHALALRHRGPSETTLTPAKGRTEDDEPGRDAPMAPQMAYLPLGLGFMPPPYFGQTQQLQQLQSQTQQLQALQQKISQLHLQLQQQPQQQQQQVSHLIPLQQQQQPQLHQLQQAQLPANAMPGQYLLSIPLQGHMIQHHSMQPYATEAAALSYFPQLPPPPASRKTTSPLNQAHARFTAAVSPYTGLTKPETSRRQKSESSNAAQDSEALFDAREIDALFSARDLLPRALVVFKLLLADLLEVDAFNFYLFLVRMLLYAAAHIPLDDFYMLLYDESAHPLKNPAKISAEKNKLDKKPADSGSVELMNVYHRILEVFKHPKELINAMPGGDYEKTRLGSVNYHELLRLFLALKIIADVLVISDDREKNCATTPRHTIYKVYYILCQKLFHKYPAMFGGNSEQKLILGPSKLGKLIKAIHPQIVAKRLGPRGFSKYHYMGLSLSENLVSEEIEALFDVEISELTKMFSSTEHESPLAVQRLPDARPDSAPTSDSRSFQYRNWMATFMDSTTAKRPLYSFIKPMCMFPPTQLSPVFCFDTPLGLKDEHSWFYQVRQYSFDELVKLDLDVSALKQHFDAAAPLETTQDWLMNNVLLAIEKLAQSPHFSKSHYLQLFLFVVVSVFPLMLCLDMTKSDAFLFNLRANVHTLVLNFEEMCLNKPYVSSGHLKSFVGILNKVLNLDDVANSLFKAKRAPAVIDEMFEDIDGLLRPIPGDESSCVLERLFTNGLVDCLNAYQFVPLMEHGAANDAQVIQLVNSVSQRMKSSIVLGLRDLVKAVDSIQESFESGLEPKKTRFEYLRLCLGFFYDHCFDEVLVERFTVAIINNYLLLVSNQIMKYIFHTQNQRASIVLNTTFRHWWVVLSFLQEYCGVVLETVGLQHMLGGAREWEEKQ